LYISAPILFARPQVISSTPRLNDRFWPTWWLAHGWLQTVWSVARWHRKPVTYERELLDVTPVSPQFFAGQIALDWAVPTLKLKAKFKSDEDEAASPIHVIFHGLSGGSQEKYVLAMVNRLLNHSPCRAVVINMRGCGGLRLKSPQAYCAAYTEDHRQAIAHIARRFPRAPLFGVGFSLGANMLAKLMGEDGAYCLLAGATCIGTPFCLLRGIAALEQSWWRRMLFSRTLATNLGLLFAGEADIMKGTFMEVPWRGITTHRLVSAFDHNITSVMFGYSSGDHYYAEASVQRYIPNIQRPTLFISSEDDPICYSSTIPYHECRSNPDVILAVTASGGHSMDHFEGIRPYSWNAVVAAQFASSLLEHLPPHRLASVALLAEALARTPSETKSRLYHPLSLGHYMQPLLPHDAHPQYLLPQLTASFLREHQHQYQQCESESEIQGENLGGGKAAAPLTNLARLLASKSAASLASATAGVAGIAEVVAGGNDSRQAQRPDSLTAVSQRRVSGQSAAVLSSPAALPASSSTTTAALASKRALAAQSPSAPPALACSAAALNPSVAAAGMLLTSLAGGAGVAASAAADDQMDEDCEAGTSASEGHGEGEDEVLDEADEAELLALVEDMMDDASHVRGAVSKWNQRLAFLTPSHA
jgi:predicted alpha/beta-fold hydrolase